MDLERRALEIALKKQRLQLQSGLLRDRLAVQAGQVVPLLQAADRVRSGVAWLRQHPLVPLAAALGFLVARPRRGLRLARRALLAWSLVRRARRWLEAWRPGHRAGPPDTG